MRLVQKLILAAVIATVTASANAASPYVRVLLPVYIAQPTRGAYGSLWTSSLAIHNASADREYTIQTECAPNEGCAGKVASDEYLEPQQTMTALPRRYVTPANPVAGATVWLLVTGAPPDNGDDVAYDLRVVDVSRSATAAGTEIPVIRESAFRTGATNLLNVPVDARFRLALRLFEMNLAQADFSIRVVDQSTNAILSEQTVTTSTGGVAPRGFVPAFAGVDNIATPPATLVRVEISPKTAGVAFWAYVSVTNNDSQQITLVTPQ